MTKEQKRNYVLFNMRFMQEPIEEMETEVFCDQADLACELADFRDKHYSPEEW